MASSASRNADKFIVRLPDGMRDKIAAAASKANRTMNAEVVSRLEFSFVVDVTVHETGYDVGHGLDSPEMKAALVKQRLEEIEPDELAPIWAELRALRAEINDLKKTR